MKRKKIKKISNKRQKLHLEPLFDDTELFNEVMYKDKGIEKLTEEETNEIEKLMKEIIN